MVLTEAETIVCGDHVVIGAGAEVFDELQCFRVLKKKWMGELVVFSLMFYSGGFRVSVTWGFTTGAMKLTEGRKWNLVVKKCGFGVLAAFRDL